MKKPDKPKKEEIARLLAQVEADPYNPATAKVLRKIAALQQQANDLDAAIATLERARALDPSDRGISNRIGDIQLAKFDAGVEKAKRAAGGDMKHPGVREALVRRTRFWMEECRRRVHDDPADLTLRFELGKALFMAGRVDEAAAEFQLATKAKGRKLDSLSYLGRCFHHQGRYVAAVEVLTEALELATTEEARWMLEHLRAESVKARRGSS